MAIHPRDLISDLTSGLNSVGSQIASDVGTTAADSVTSTTSNSVKTTSSSNTATASTKATSTSGSTVSSTSKSIRSSSSSSGSAAASTMTSSPSTTSSDRTASSASPSTTSSMSTRSSTLSTSTLTSTSTTSSSPSASTTALPAATGNQISTAGVAVAAIFAVLIISGIIFLAWKYLPAAQRYRERRYQARSHRQGLSFSSSRKGLAFADEETVELHLDDPKQGLGLHRLSYNASDDRRPLTSASAEHEYVSPMSLRSMNSHISHSTLPSALQVGPRSYIPYSNPYQHQDVRASQIGVAVPFQGSGSGIWDGNGPSAAVPLPSIGYGKTFS